jgi:hypothetical protein
VLGIVGGPGYSPPPPPRGFFVPGGHVETWGVRLAAELGDSYVGVEHAFLAMIGPAATAMPTRPRVGPARGVTRRAAVDEK